MTDQLHTGVDPRLLGQITADVAQLANPIHIAIRGKIITHPPLLDQLRDAVTPGATANGSQRHAAPASRPAANLTALDTLAAIYVELGGWHARQRLPSPPRHADWQKTVLRQLANRAPDLAPAIADWLATDLHDWWRWAATHTGWRTTDLLRVR